VNSADAVQAIMIACDACDDRRYKEAREILADVPMVIIRTRDAGVHFGQLAFIANAQHGTYRVVLANARRIWNWSGANTLNEIALRGFESGKVSDPVLHNVIPQVIEVIVCSPESEKRLNKARW
jgi:hypothetical protein